MRLRTCLYKTDDSYPPHVGHSTCLSLVQTNEHNTRLCTSGLYFCKIKQMRLETNISQSSYTWKFALLATAVLNVLRQAILITIPCFHRSQSETGFYQNFTLDCMLFCSDSNVNHNSAFPMQISIINPDSNCSCPLFLTLRTIQFLSLFTRSGGSCLGTLRAVNNFVFLY